MTEQLTLSDFAPALLGLVVTAFALLRFTAEHRRRAKVEAMKEKETVAAAPTATTAQKASAAEAYETARARTAAAYEQARAGERAPETWFARILRAVAGTLHGRRPDKAARATIPVPRIAAKRSGAAAAAAPTPPVSQTLTAKPK